MWLFVTDDGALARSDTFLGPLSRVGDLGARALAQTATRGRLALTTPDGALHEL